MGMLNSESLKKLNINSNKSIKNTWSMDLKIDTNATLSKLRKRYC